MISLSKRRDERLYFANICQFAGRNQLYGGINYLETPFNVVVSQMF